jgi:hypothetical protein
MPNPVSQVRDNRHFNKDAYKNAARKHDKIKHEQIRSYIAGYLSRHPCLDCGEADPIVLEFDHRNRPDKKFNIGDAARKRFSLAKVVSEIDKCDVRCANCHRRKTFKERWEASSRRENFIPPLPLFDRDG